MILMDHYVSQTPTNINKVSFLLTIKHYYSIPLYVTVTLVARKIVLHRYGCVTTAFMSLKTHLETLRKCVVLYGGVVLELTKKQRILGTLSRNICRDIIFHSRGKCFNNK